MVRREQARLSKDLPMSELGGGGAAGGRARGGRVAGGGVGVGGGGRAGGSAALALARGGAEVVLYLPERPGEKPCGGAVPDHVLPRIAGFAADGLPAIMTPPLRLEDALGALLDSALLGIRIFRRRDLDQAIVDAA